MPPIRKLLSVLSLTCDASSRLLSDRFERKLDRVDTAALRLHLMTCTGCKHTNTHFTQLHDLNKRLHGGKAASGARLSREARRRIGRMLEGD